jgi:hypothetical protein
MKRNSIFLVLIGFFIFISQSVSGQISEGGTPISFYLDMHREAIPMLKMPQIDTKSLLEEDANKANDFLNKPFRFGYAIDVEIDLKKVGLHRKMENGKWRQFMDAETTLS